MMKLVLNEYSFSYVADLIPDNANGKAIAYAPQQRYNNTQNLPLLPEGDGEFCRFCLPGLTAVAGVYAWISKNEVVYIGETRNMKYRFNNGYGIISPRNCYKGGQKTNCKMNKVAMNCYNSGAPVKLYFLRTNDYKMIEKELIRSLMPKYNEKDNKGSVI